MDIKIDRNICVPVYQQISRKIEEKILSRELNDGFKLPAERRLAAELDVHRNTVIKAYSILVAKGLVVTSRNRPKGYFVKSVRNPQNFGNRFFPLEKAFIYEFKKAEKTFNDVYWNSENEAMISFGGINMSRKLNPVKNMGHVTERIFDCSEKGCTQGFYEETKHLKENICRLLTEQNVYVEPKNIQILAESNQALGYLMTLYLREGDCIIAEEPIVPDNFSTFYNRGIRIITVPLEKDGMRMDMLEEALREHKPKFIYTLPNYHNPTGITMSLEKRQTLLKLANEYNVPIIEEDYQREFTYEEQRIPCLYALDTNRLVIYVDSFTMTFPYMMKIGYVVGPSDLIDMLRYALSIDETVVSNIGQYFLNEYIDSGEYAKHVNILREACKSKLELLCSELDKIAYKGITYVKPKGGVLLWCSLDDDINERTLYKLITEKGVIVLPGWVFYTSKKRRGGHIRLCFSNVTDEQICRGVILIGEALDESRAENKDEKGEQTDYE